MAATATILAPLQGDTVLANDVVITCAYAGFGGQTLKGKIATKLDNPFVPVDADGVHAGSTITGVPTGPQAVKAMVNDVDKDTQNGVIVSNGPLPVPVEEPLGPTEGKEAKKKYTVKGKHLPIGSTAVYVVCQAVEVDTTAHTRTPVAAGATTVEAGKTWKVDLEFDVKNAANIQYVVRAFAFNANMQLIGSQTVFSHKS